MRRRTPRGARRSASAMPPARTTPPAPTIADARPDTRPDARPDAQPVARPSSFVAAKAALEPPARPRAPAAANDASDPAAAGPAPAAYPAVTRLARAWCEAYSRWGVDPHAGAARALRSLSTPGLYASLAIQPPARTAAPANSATVRSVQAFRVTDHFDAIVDLRFDGADVVLELRIVTPARGPLVSALSL